MGFQQLYKKKNVIQGIPDGFIRIGKMTSIF